jgi:hypothetical protein
MPFAHNAFGSVHGSERYVLKASGGAPLVKAEPLLNDYGGIDRRLAFFASQSSICFRERNYAFDIAARIENANLA